MAAVVLSAALIFAGVDSSPWETSYLRQLEASAPAARVVEDTCMNADPNVCDPPTTPPRAVWAHCEEWHDLAADVGWPESQGPTLSYVMFRESRCNPNAHNPSGATGLLQLLGWRCDGGCFNPRGNLAKGLELWQSSGWHPWCLRGDPVTGSC